MAKLDADTVREIWDVRHKEDPERVGAIITGNEFKEMRAKVARQCVSNQPLCSRARCPLPLLNLKLDVRACGCGYSPTFVFKVPRGESAFTVLVANFPVLTVDKPTTCLFSLADEYRASAHSCEPVMSVNFWNEFGSTKDVVLIRATIMPGVVLSR